MLLAEACVWDDIQFTVQPPPSHGRHLSSGNAAVRSVHCFSLWRSAGINE